ncbi:MAG: four helix bundle protein [Bacteroidota bacterium]
MGESKELNERTKNFALEIIRLVDVLPREISNGVLGKQILRAGTSIGANYRAACRGRSAAEFIAKMHTVQEEADECQYWLDLLHGSKKIGEDVFMRLMQEARELTAIFTASEMTARKNLKR